MPCRQFLQVALNQKQLLVRLKSILQNLDAVWEINLHINALVFLKHIFQKEEQEEKERIENERLEIIELL